jgi:2-methylfumaryl-CoA isomerase
VNHVLPAWDVSTGLLAAVGLLAADRRRLRTAEGGLVRLSLGEVAVAVASHLGLLEEARLIEEPRGRFGNHLYGTFARDFRTADGRFVIVLALTPRQWSSLEIATGLPFDRIQADLTDEGERWRHREEICRLLEPWIGARTQNQLAEVFEEHQVLWGPYRTFKELIADDPLAAAPPATPLRFGAEDRVPAPEGPELGADTEAVLGELGEDVDGLRAAGVIA